MYSYFQLKVQEALKKKERFDREHEEVSALLVNEHLTKVELIIT